MKLIPPLDKTGPDFADAAMLWALAMMLARSRGAAPVASGFVLAAAVGGGGGGGASGMLTGVWPGCWVGGKSRPAPRRAPSRAIGSGVAGFAGSALWGVGDRSAATIAGAI